LAAVPLRSDDAGTRHEPVQAGFAATAHSARGVPLQRGPVQGADANTSGRREANAGEIAAGSPGALPGVRGSGVARRQPVPPGLGRTPIMSLATKYLGLQLAHLIVASAAPLSGTLDGMRQLEDAGAAAVVMSSLYEDQIRAED